MTSTSESDVNSHYVESTKTSHKIPSNTLYLELHISDLGEMYEVAEGKFVELAQPTMLFSCIDKLELPNLDDAKTDPPETTKTVALC